MRNFFEKLIAERYKKETNAENDKKERKLPPETIEHFREYILEGGTLIRNGQYQEAVAHFQNNEELRKIDAQLSRGEALFIDEYPDSLEEIREISHILASESWHWTPERELKFVE